MFQAALFPVEKKDRYDVDLSGLELPEDEPLSSKIIDAYRQLAYSVVMQALDDLANNDEPTRRSAEEFCLSNRRAHRQNRLLWIGWLKMEEETLAKAARKRKSCQEPLRRAA